MVAPTDHILADEWFENAKNALGYAQTGLHETSFHAWICFLSQQAAEFYLKGFLVLHHCEPPRTHDLTTLLRLCCGIRPELVSLRVACSILTQYYIEARYPPEVKSYAKSDAEEAVRNAAMPKGRDEMIGISSISIDPRVMGESQSSLELG